MNIIRKLFLGVCFFLFIASLFVLAADVSVTRVITNPDRMKQIVADSGIYKTAINGSIDDSKKLEINRQDIPLTSPKIRAAANKTFDGAYLQKTSEYIVDGVYKWLEGDIKKPDFNIDLSAKREKFIAAIADAAETRIAKLPECPAQDGNKAGSYNLFSDKCRPPGLTPAQAAKQFKQKLLASKDFLHPAVINAETIKSVDSNKSIFADQLKDLPDVYQAIKFSPLVLALISLALMGLIVLLSRPHIDGLLHSGIVLFGIGLMVLLASVYSYAALSATDFTFESKNAAFGRNASILTKDILQELGKSWIVTSAIFTAVGGAIVGTIEYRKHRSKPAATAPTAAPAEPAKPKAPAKKKPAKKISVK